MSKDSVARQILAQQLMQAGQQNTSPLAAGINSFTGAYMLAKEGKKADAEKKALADALSGVQQSQPLPADFMGPGTRQQQPGGQNAAKQALISAMIGSSDDQLQKAGLTQMFPSMGAGSGGQIEYMYNKIKAENPKLSDTEILHMAQTGFRQNLMRNPDGSVSDVPGAAGALGNLAQGKKTGENKSDLQYKPLIASGEAGAKQAQELNYAAPIAGAKKSADIAATQQGDVNKQALTSTKSIALLESAAPLLNQASGGGASSLYQAGKKFVGSSDETTRANKRLEVLSGYLTANVPRMEGPQSNFDVINYQTMAGSLGDKSVPIEDRKATLKTLLSMQAYYSKDPKLMAKYPGYGEEPQLPAENAGNAEESVPTGGNIFTEGQTATNPKTGQKLTFRGGKWQ